MYWFCKSEFCDWKFALIVNAGVCYNTRENLRMPSPRDGGLSRGGSGYFAGCLCSITVVKNTIG